MSRLVFLSFLGTGNYNECNYYLETIDNKIENVKYIQEALIKLLKNKGINIDEFLIFLTNDAKSKNWNDKLEIILNNLKVNYNAIDIKDGKSESEIWDILETLYNSINEGDKIILDITHSFRSIPMICMVFLSYAKVLKNIEIKGIYYGAFEAKNNNNDAPVFDLTPLFDLMKITEGANNFINFGNTRMLVKILKEYINLHKSENKNQDIIIKFGKLSNSLETLFYNFETNRGQEIISGKIFEDLKTNINNFETDRIPALKPILEKINDKIKNFEKDNIYNGFKAVKWCIDNEMIQQGITLLQENIVSYILFKNNIVYMGNDNKIRNNRENMSNALRTYNNKNENLILSEEVIKFQKFKEVEKLYQVYNSLTNIRNSINHAGFCDSKNYNEFISNLKLMYNNVKEIINRLESKDVIL